MRSITRTIRTVTALGALALAVACSGSTGGGSGSRSGFNPPKLEAQKAIGPGEGRLNLIAWAGYAENGSNDPKVDWVTPFQKQTGCQVNAKTAGTSDEMVSLIKTGEYDAVSASGDASLRLIASGDAAPVNTGLLTNYRDISPSQKMQKWNSVNGVAYGIPHGYGANLLAYRTDKVNPAPTSWSSVFAVDSPYAKHISAYDSPIYLADAAVYLMSAKPELGIKDPYALDQKQFDAAVALLKQQNRNIGEYWSDYLKAASALKSGNTVIGSSWQVVVNTAVGEGAPVATALPTEGATGWADTWMVYAKAQHPNCAYQWLNWITSPKVNAQVAEYFGEAPANQLACQQTTDKNFCTTYHAGDTAYWSRVHFWATPVPQCLDGRTDTTCVPYAQWVQAWTAIKG
ncbi:MULTISPECIES: ABC transporter substrate-binding protein [Kitasatospora]|uniref:ABC transporter substrate-binding protein n=1 Tax=Kitasatospora cystarginea TaxID=58350 RepID=A0ABN3DM08_9ACTN